MKQYLIFVGVFSGVVQAQTLPCIRSFSETDSQAILREAQQGNPVAQNQVAQMYLYHSPDKVSGRKEAFRFFKKAAERGYAPAQTALATMYYQGYGFKFLEWLEHAKKDKSKIRTIAIVANYYQEHDLPKSQLEKFASKGHLPSKVFLNWVNNNNAEEVFGYKKEAFRWYRKAALQGDSVAQFMLGYMQLYGIGVPKKETSALFWIRKSARQEHAPAQRQLAQLYLEGRGVRFNRERAILLLRQAALQGDSVAQNQLKELALHL